jgi:hypothetical protein
MTPEMLTAIAQTFGTPTYVYDLDRIKSQYASFEAAFDWPKLKICYAMKANYNPDLLKTLLNAGAGIDAVSPGDLHLALACGFRVEDIIYTANNITDQEMAAVAKTGVLMNIDSLSRLEKYGRAFPRTRVCLRFNPDVVDGEYDKIKTGGALTKFGILLEDAPEAARLAQKFDLRVTGAPRAHRLGPPTSGFHPQGHGQDHGHCHTRPVCPPGFSGFRRRFQSALPAGGSTHRHCPPGKGGGGTVFRFLHRRRQGPGTAGRAG